MKEQLIKTYNDFIANGSNISALGEELGIPNTFVYMLVKIGEWLVEHKK